VAREGLEPPAASLLRAAFSQRFHMSRIPIRMAGATGLEPAASCLTGIQLRRLRPLGLLFFEATLRLLSLRPDGLLTILKMALSIDLRDSVSLLPSIHATRF
jgi:hypothetical protein